MPAGRPPERTNLVEKTAGSPVAKTRLRVILETLSGERTMQSACDELEISPAMFYKLRARFLQEEVEGLERRTPGVKPRHQSEAGAEIKEMNKRIDELESELHLSRIREEIALVVKEDNGSAFCSHAMQTFFHRHQIEPLYSPVRNPSYNGSCEAAIGAMKIRTHEVAFEAGRPGQWRSEDPEVALARSHDGGYSPVERAGQPVLPELRQSFRERVAELRAGLRADYELNGLVEINSLEERLVQRQAVSRALVEHGILSIRRGPKSLRN